jgi:hypothetical protein
MPDCRSRQRIPGAGVLLVIEETLPRLRCLDFWFVAELRQLGFEIYASRASTGSSSRSG